MESIHQRFRFGKTGIGFFSYYADANHKEQPAMFLANTRNEGTSYAIPLDHAHEYSDEHHLMLQSMTIADKLDMGTDRSTVYRIADAILNHLPDLVKMPPKPPRPGNPQEEMARDGIVVTERH